MTAYWIALAALVAALVASLALLAWRDWLRHRAVVELLAWRTAAARCFLDAEVEEAVAETWAALWQGAQAVAEAERAR